MRRKLITFLAVGALASLVNMTKAATVTCYLTTVGATPTSGTWQLYVADSLDNDGLANYDFDIVGVNGAVVNTTATIKAPRPTDSSNQYADGLGGIMGFNSSVNGGSNSGTGRVGITGGQDTVYGASDDPTFDMGIMVGVGQEAPTASPQNSSQGPWDGSGTPTGLTVNATTPWAYTTPGTQVNGGTGAGGAPIIKYHIGGTLIEQGTYTVPGGLGANPAAELDANVDGFVEVLGTSDNAANELWDLVHQQGNTPAAAIQPNSEYTLPANVNGTAIPLNVPEPASLGLVVIGMGLAATGRKMRRKTA